MKVVNCKQTIRRSRRAAFDVDYNDTTLTPAKELAISIEVCKLHPHKQDPSNWRVQSFIIRKSWGLFKSLCKGEKVYGD